MSDTAEYSLDFAFHVGMERFIIKIDGKWQLSPTVKHEGLKFYLKDVGFSPDNIVRILDEKLYYHVYGFDSVPWGGTLLDKAGKKFINLWVPPTLKPSPGPWNRIERVITHLCDYDEAAVLHLINWLAYKIQNPTAIPRTAIVFGTAQGAGKGTLFKILSEILGPDNCVEIGKKALQAQFNGYWAGKLLVQANEVVDNDNAADVNERLKAWIDSPYIEIERKGQDAYTIQNVSAWMFSTNASTGAVKVEESDRRFNIFTNFSPLTDDYKASIMELFPPGGIGWSEVGMAEVQGFYQSLLDHKVDMKAVGTPMNNAARQALIEASRPLHDMFKAEVDEQGVDHLIKLMADAGDYQLTKNKPSWDFGEEGVSIDVIYDAYCLYVQDNGGKTPLRKAKFKAAVENAHPKWEKSRKNVPGTNNTKKTACYVVKRGAAK